MLSLPNFLPVCTNPLTLGFMSAHSILRTNSQPISLSLIPPCFHSFTQQALNGHHIPGIVLTTEGKCVTKPSLVRRGDSRDKKKKSNIMAKAIEECSRSSGEM